MLSLSDCFATMYEVDLDTLDLVILVPCRIRAERRRNAGLEKSTAYPSANIPVGSRR
jgi:hypothetical protein